MGSWFLLCWPRPVGSIANLSYAAYTDLKAALDSVDLDALFKLLEIIGSPRERIRLFRGLYTETVSCVRCEGELSQWFEVKTGCSRWVHSAFNVAMDRILGRTVSGTHLGSSLGEAACSDFDFADDVTLLAEVYNTLTSAMSFFKEEASELGLHTNWLKQKCSPSATFSRGRQTRRFRAEPWKSSRNSKTWSANPRIL